MAVRIGLAGVFFLMLFSSVPSQANYLAPSSYEDISAIFCDKLEDEDMYNESNLEPYKLLIQGKNGWIFRSESDLRNDFSLHERTLDNIEDLARAFKSRGTELVILLPPTRGLMHYANLLEKDQRRYGFTEQDTETAWGNYWDMISALQKRGVHAVGISRPDPQLPFFYKRDHHWSPEGARYTAKLVSDYIRRLPVYDEIDKVEYITRNLAPFEFNGVSKKVFRKLCNTTQPPETIIRSVTERKNLAYNPNDILGDATNPEIVLLGTSNSTMEPSYSNFEGFLKESLSADILNMSVSGGGLDTAVISYLNSTFYESQPAKIAIWEIPGYYDINKHRRFFREAVPAVYGNCSDPVAFSRDVKLDHKNTIVLEGIAKKKVTGSDYYVMLDFSSRITEPFFIDLRYRKNRDRYKFQRSGRYPHDGRFYVGLRDNKKSHLDKIVIKVTKNLKGKTVSAKICRKDKEHFLSFAGKSLELNDGSAVIEAIGKIKGLMPLTILPIGNGGTK